MYFIGTSNALGHGVGTVLISPKDEYYQFTVRLNFNYTNNMAKYEKCVMEFHMTIEKKFK